SSTLPAARAAATGRDIELRGTLLCRVQGDPRRERPGDAGLVVIEPVGHPERAEVLGEAGLFRIRVPAEVIEHQIFLKVHGGSESVQMIQASIEPGRLRRWGDQFVYPLGSYTLTGRCEDLDGDPALALQLRDQIRSTAPGVPAERAGLHISRPAAG